MRHPAWHLAGLASMAFVHSPAQGLQREHAQLQREVGSGELVPLSEVRQRLAREMHGHQYIGAEFDPQARIYRLKFIRKGGVVWVDVEARSGRVIGRAAPRTSQ